MVAGTATPRRRHHAHTRRSTAGVAGPRSTRSPRNTAVRPGGGPRRRPGRRVPVTRYPSVPSSDSSSVWQPWMSPMMSNGPVRSRLSVHNGSRTHGRLDLGGLRQRVEYPEPLPVEPAPSGAAGSAGVTAALGPELRSGRLEFRCVQGGLGHVEDDGHGQRVVGLGQVDEPLAGGGLDVGRIHHGPGRRACQRRSQHVEASQVAAWSFSSSDTSPRKKSEEITSNGRKWWRRTWTCPTRSRRPGPPRRARGIGTQSRLNTAIWVGEPTSGSSGPPAELTW